MPGGDILLGGESFISRYTTELREQWTISTQSPVTAITAKGSNIYASTQGTILLLGADGRIIQEWGPYADSSVITSVTATDKLVAFADAGTRKVYIFDTGGELRKIIGAEEQGFILPSHYFDAAFGTDNTLYIANTGKLRIEKWTTDGEMSGSFGESGLAPGAFCGCCNPSHFAPLPQGGFVTAEKGINRIKILDGNGNFIEFVSVNNKFMASVPLDVVAAADGGAIYAANPADSKLYIFKRNN
jgi:DNA-binding beta-propeller fold protein YncE